MDLSNTRVLNFSRTNNFFDSDFRFGANTSYTIEGYLLDLQNDIGVSGILEASTFFRTGLQDYQDINLNGENFGKGRVESFSVDESDFVRRTIYSLQINGFESGNLHNLSGEYYDGLTSLTGFVQASHLLENFSENFDFSRSDDSYSYTHNITIKYASGDNILISPIDRAKLLATYILTGSNPSFGFVDSQTSGLYTGNYKEYFNESYDAINNTVNISKRFNSLNPSGTYGITLRHAFDRQENGITNVTENAQLKTQQNPKKTILNSAFQTEISNSFGRCSGVYNFYLGDGNLNSNPLILTQNKNFFEGVGDYSVTYTNDPAFNNNYIWRHTNEIEKNGTFYITTERGDIKGLGSDSLTKYNNAASGYNIVKAGVLGRVSGFYVSSLGQSKKLNLISKTEGKNKFDGTVEYGYDYTDEPSYEADGLKKVEVTVEDSLPVDFINSFQILGYKEIVQSIGTTTLGQRNLNINLVGHRESSLTDILSVGKTRANNYIPSGSDVHISDVNYAFNQEEKAVNLSVLWNYNRESRNSEVL